MSASDLCAAIDVDMLFLDRLGSRLPALHASARSRFRVLALLSEGAELRVGLAFLCAYACGNLDMRPNVENLPAVRPRTRAGLCAQPEHRIDPPSPAGVGPFAPLRSPRVRIRSAAAAAEDQYSSLHRATPDSLTPLRFRRGAREGLRSPRGKLASTLANSAGATTSRSTRYTTRTARSPSGACAPRLRRRPTGKRPDPGDESSRGGTVIAHRSASFELGKPAKYGIRKRNARFSAVAFECVRRQGPRGAS